MKVVIDTNRIMAALIKNSTSRKILFSKKLSFVAPDHSLAEIYKHRKEIEKKQTLAITNLKYFS